MIDQEEFEHINQLRLQAFRTNESQDVENYYKAASSWFQDELGREVRRSYESAAEITQLRAERDAYESALEEIATYDTGATAGLAYTAQQALATRRNK